MKQTEPNPLQRELARSQQAESHPDADLLTGFAEGSLLEREREEMFAHLARCAECRELLNVAMGAVANPAAVSRPFLLERAAPSPLRAWLPWMSLAAGIVLVCTVGLVYRQRLEMKEHTGTENKAQISTAGQPIPPASIEPNPDASGSAAKPRAGTLMSAEPAQEASPMASAGGVPAGDLKQSDAGENSTQNNTATAQANNEESAAAQSGLARMQVQAQDEAQARAQIQPQIQVQPAPEFVDKNLGRVMNKASLAAAPPHPNWRIDNAGAVERTLGNGVWQKVLTDENAKIAGSARSSNAEVWVGGDNARLSPFSRRRKHVERGDIAEVKDGHDHAIIHISFQTQQAGSAIAADGTSWTSTDGGVSWK